MTMRRAHPSVAIVLAINLAWTVVAALSSDARPWGPLLWQGELSPVEKLEVVLLIVYIAAWAWVAARLRRVGSGRRRWLLAAAMAVQLVVLLGEELDWGGALGPFRNAREVLHLVLPQILDTPMAAAYLLAFLLAPLVPSERVRSWLESAYPVRAERGDAWALVAVPLCWGLVWVLVGDQKLGELHQLSIYAVVGVITQRVVRQVAVQ